MKICFLITGLGTGGAENHLLKLVPKLKFEKFIISLTNKNSVGKQIKKEKVKIYYLGLNKFNLINVILKFRKIIKKEKPDIIDTYLIHSNIFGRIFGRMFGVKKIISSVRNDYSDLPFLNFIDKITKGLVDMYIPNSQSLINYLYKKNNVPLKKIAILPNGVDVQEIYSSLDKKYDIRKELKIAKDSFVITCVARIHKQKNIAKVVSAMRYINENIVFVIVGKDDGEKDHINYLIEKHGLEKKVFMIGRRKDIPSILNSSNVFILPSFKEGMSNALLEAMALKKCCIVSDIPQNTELIKNNKNGFVFDHNNAKDIAKIINKSKNSNRRKELGENSFKLIKEKYETKKVIVKYKEILKNIMRK